MTTLQVAPVRRLPLFLRLSALGLLGVLTLVPSLPALLKNLPAGAPPLPVMILIAVLQSFIMVAATAALGTWLAPKIGLEAPVLAGRLPLSSLRESAPFSLLAGAATGAVLVFGDVPFRSYIPANFYTLAQKPAVADLLPALGYGGIGEEILMRWGLMTLIAWVLCLIFGRGKGTARPAVIWASILGAAVLFGLGHLPAVRAMGGDLTAVMIVRTLFLNGVGGVVFGWLYYKRGLENAMVGHMGAHLGMFLLRILFAG